MPDNRLKLLNDFESKAEHYRKHQDYTVEGGLLLFANYKKLIEANIKELDKDDDLFITYQSDLSPEPITGTAQELLGHFQVKYFSPLHVSFHVSAEEEKKNEFPSTKYQAPSFCTIKLLAIAAESNYRVKEDGLIDTRTVEDGQAVTDIARYGYSITRTSIPDESTGLSAMVLMPQHAENPIIIAFRGTTTFADVLSDIKLTVTGTVSKPLRIAAYNYFLDIRKEYPDREIILTGHSLGGHLAHYVAAKAYNEDATLQANLAVQVRTFNTAAGKTEHGKILKTYPHIAAWFINYRLHRDKVSKVIFQNYEGNTFDFLTHKNSFNSHRITSIHECLPKNVMNLEVGTSATGNKTQRLLLEFFHGTLNSYECHIHSKLSADKGLYNLRVFEANFPLIIKDIQNDRYSDAIARLLACRKLIKGSKSKGIIGSLLKSLGREGILQNNLAILRDQIEAIQIVKGVASTHQARAKLLFDYCALEPCQNKITAYIDKPFAHNMLKNLNLINIADLNRVEFLLNILLKQAYKTLVNKREKSRAASGIIKFGINAVHRFNGNDYQRIELILDRLKEGDTFVNSAKLSKLLEAKPSITKKKIINLIQAVLNLQLKKEAAMSKTPGLSINSLPGSP